MSLTRREFNKTVLTATAGFGTSLYLPALPITDKSIVAIAKSPKLKRIDNKVNKAAAVQYLNKAMCKITGRKTAKDAWKSLFKPHESVGIKLSCLPGPPLSSSHGVVWAIVDGLISAGIKGRHIYIWERTDCELERAGFPISTSGFNIVGTDHYNGSGYSNDIEFSGSVGTCFSRIAERVDTLISVPVLKDHDIAGVSIGMKNFYGAIHNPNKFHGNCCDPYVAEICNHRFIKDKLRLTVCDATRAQYNNGPAFFQRYAWEYGGLLVSRDPVALDYVGWQMIEEKRKKEGLKSLKNCKREPTYIKTAEKLGLGHANINKIIREVVE